MFKKDRAVSEGRATRILLADDHRPMREGMRGLIEKLPGAEVVAEAVDGIGAVRLAREFLPDLAILDVNMPTLNGIEATRRIVPEAPGVRILGVSVYTDKRFVEEMLGAGASGFLPKDSIFEELPHAIRVVISGGTYLSPAILDQVEPACIGEEPATYPAMLGVLASSEREALKLIARGLSTEDIATRLRASPEEVQGLRRKVMSKVGLYTMEGLARYALHQGLLGPDH